MSAVPRVYLTPAEYLAMERQSETKNEYYDGEIFAMAGASQSHVTIMMNTSYLLVGQLKGRSCRAFGVDMRVKVSPTGLFTYPDLSVVCGKPRFEDKELDTLLNPTVLIEILSKSTEAYDRGEKFAQYRTLDTLTDYLLISQDAPRIEHYVRQDGGLWLFSESVGLDGVMAIESIDCQLPLADVYDRVDFSVTPSAPTLTVVKEQDEAYTAG